MATSRKSTSVPDAKDDLHTIEHGPSATTQSGAPYIVSLFMPPLGIYLEEGCTHHVTICMLIGFFTLGVGAIPYAIYIIHRAQDEPGRHAGGSGVKRNPTVPLANGDSPVRGLPKKSPTIPLANGNSPADSLPKNSPTIPLTNGGSPVGKGSSASASPNLPSAMKNSPLGRSRTSVSPGS